MFSYAKTNAIKIDFYEWLDERKYNVSDAEGQKHWFIRWYPEIRPQTAYQSWSPNLIPSLWLVKDMGRTCIRHLCYNGKEKRVTLLQVLCSVLNAKIRNPVSQFETQENKQRQYLRIILKFMGLYSWANIPLQKSQWYL